jgi:hypothetical protein
MDVADPTEMAILDAIRQAPSDRLIEILNFIRGLSSDEAADPMAYAGVTPGGSSGFDLYRHKEIAGVALFDGGMVVYE